METTNAIQQIYIGLLGRAADQEGLQYWTDEIEAGTLTLEQLRANIVEEQQEYKDTFGGQTRAQVVSQLYANLFNRAPDDEGLQYWVNGEGASVNIDQLVLALVNGAAAADSLVLDNRTEVANYYTEELGAEGSFDAELAGAVIADVDGTRASVTQAKASVDNGDITAPTPNEGNTFTLTAASNPLTGGADIVSGTAVNDTFQALGAGSLGTGDALNGLGGNDVLNISAGAIATTNKPQISNIETINNADTATALDLDATTGVTTINSTVAGTATYTNANIDTVFGIKGTATTVDVSYKGVTGANDVAKFAVENNGATVGALTVASTGSAGAVEGAVISATGKVANTADITALTAVKSIAVEGAGNVTVTATAATVTSFDASEATGNVTWTSGATTGDLAVKTGAGVDVIDLTLATGKATVSGSAGGDTITLGGAADTVVYTDQSQSTYANFDTIAGFATTADKIDLSDLGLDAQTTALTAGVTTQTTIGGLANGVDGFFGENTVATFADGGTNYLMADVNGNGNFDATEDMVIALGTATPVIADILFA